jgi:hypothetical protein
VESFCQLTALQHLGLVVIMNVVSNPSSLGMLGQLTSLELDFADWAIGQSSRAALDFGRCRLAVRHVCSMLLEWLSRRGLCLALLMHTV